MRPRKPAKSYNELIQDALASHHGGPLLLRDIYQHLQTQYDYFRQADQGWKNSVRHALSACEWFEKAPLIPSRGGRSRTAWRLAPKANLPVLANGQESNQSSHIPATPSTIVANRCADFMSLVFSEKLPKSPNLFPTDCYPGFADMRQLKSSVNVGVETDGLRLWMPILPRDPLSDSIGLPPIEIPMDIARRMEDMSNTGGSSLSNSFLTDHRFPL